MENIENIIKFWPIIPIILSSVAIYFARKAYLARIDDYKELWDCRAMKWGKVKKAILKEKDEYFEMKYLGQYNGIIETLNSELPARCNKYIYCCSEMSPPGFFHPLEQFINILILKTNKKNKLILFIQNQTNVLETEKFIRITDFEIFNRYDVSFDNFIKKTYTPEIVSKDHANNVNRCSDNYLNFYIKNNEESMFLLPLPKPIKTAQPKENEFFLNLQFKEWEEYLIGSYNNSYRDGILKDTKYLFITWFLEPGTDNIRIQKGYIEKMKRMLESFKDKTKHKELIIDRTFILDASCVTNQEYIEFIKYILTKFIISDKTTKAPPSNYRIRFVSNDINESINDIAIFSNSSETFRQADGTNGGTTLPSLGGYTHLQYYGLDGRFLKLFITESGKKITDTISGIRHIDNNTWNKKRIDLTSKLGITDFKKYYNFSFNFPTE